MLYIYNSELIYLSDLEGILFQPYNMNEIIQALYNHIQNVTKTLPSSINC